MRVPYSRLGHPTPTVLQCQQCLGKPKSNEGRRKRRWQMPPFTARGSTCREEEAAWVRGGKARPTGLRRDPPCLRYSCLRAHPGDDRALPSFHSISPIRRHSQRSAGQGSAADTNTFMFAGGGKRLMSNSFPAHFYTESYVGPQ